VDSEAPEAKVPEVTNRAAVFEALAQGESLAGVRQRFGLSPEELLELFREVADHYRKTGEGFWSLHTDGASRGNPGPAGAGFILRDPGGEVRAQEGRYLGVATNNVAEYRGLLLGLQAAQKRGILRLRIFSDSELLVRQLNGSYRVKSPHLLPLWQEAQKELQKFQAHDIRHVPRELNAGADALANQAIDRKPPTG
jgi:ribonuclease HI